MAASLGNVTLFSFNETRASVLSLGFLYFEFVSKFQIVQESVGRNSGVGHFICGSF